MVINSGAALFVSAVGVPPPQIVKKLHDAGILYMNMIGHPKHAIKACEAGADIICAQGGEAGGHTGDIPFRCSCMISSLKECELTRRASSVLIPACADVCKRYTSPITGKEVLVVAAGGVGDGRSIAAALMLGAAGVWVGTRFVPCLESGASESAKKSIVDSDFNSAMVTLAYTGRPCRVFATPYLLDWETNRKNEMKDLLAKGLLPVEHDMETAEKEGNEKRIQEIENGTPFRPMGIVAGMVTKLNQVSIFLL